MRMNPSALIALLCLSAGSLIAAEEAAAPAAPAASESRPSRRGGDRGGAGGERGGGMESALRGVNEQLKAKYPKEYTEIEELDKTDRRAGFTKRRELAEKAGIEMPSFGGNRGGRGGDRSRTDASKAEDLTAAKAEWEKFENDIKTKYPTEYAEIEKLKTTDLAAALTKLKALAEKGGVKVPETKFPEEKNIPARDLGRLALERAEAIVSERYPEDYAKVVAMREEDPDAAREMFRALVRRTGISADGFKRMVTHRPPTAMTVKMPPSVDSTTGSSSASGNTGGNRGNRGGGNWGGGMPGGNWGGGPRN